MIKMTTLDFMLLPGVRVGWSGGVDADDGVWELGVRGPTLHPSKISLFHSVSCHSFVRCFIRNGGGTFLAKVFISFVITTTPTQTLWSSWHSSTSFFCLSSLFCWLVVSLHLHNKDLRTPLVLILPMGLWLYVFMFVMSDWVWGTTVVDVMWCDVVWWCCDLVWHELFSLTVYVVLAADTVQSWKPSNCLPSSSHVYYCM